MGDGDYLVAGAKGKDDLGGAGKQRGDVHGYVLRGRRGDAAIERIIANPPATNPAAAVAAEGRLR